MALLDGELSGEHAKTVRRHLRGCTHCKQIFATYQSATSAFTSQNLFPGLEKSPPTRIAPALTKPMFATHFAARDRSMRPAWAASLAMTLSILLLWQLVLTPPELGAREMISRARIEEQRPLMGATKPVVQRTLRTTRRVAGIVEQDVEHVETWDGVPGHIRKATETNPLARELAATIPIPECSRFSPLSVGMMHCLAGTNTVEMRVLTPPRDLETEVYQLAMQSLRPAKGNPFVSVWTLRISDWHLTQVEFRFYTLPEDVEYRVEETAYRLVDGHPRVAESSPGSEVSIEEAPSISPPPTRMEYDPAEGLNIRLAVFRALHALELTPEDEIDISWHPGEPVKVSALVASAERKRNLENALAAIDGIALGVLSYEEASILAQAVELFPGASETEVPAHVARNAAPLRSEGPLLLDELSEHFGGGDRGKELALGFGISLLEETQELHFQVRWMERMQKAFLPEERALLSPAAQIQLAQMESAIRAKLESRHTHLQLLVRSIICPRYCNTSSADPHLRHPWRLYARDHASAVTSEELALAMDREFALLKVLFVDREFTPPSEQGSELPTVAEQIHRWEALSVAFSQLLPDEAAPAEHAQALRSLAENTAPAR